MSAQHKRPLLAFLLVALVCGLLIGHAVRSEALLGLWAAGDQEPLGAERVRLSAGTRDRVVADAQRVRSPRAPARASATSASPRTSSRPLRGPARSLAPVDGGGLRAAQEPKVTPPGLAKKPGGLPPGLAKKAGKHAHGLPPGLAKKAGKHADGLPPGLAKKAGKHAELLPPGLAKKAGKHADGLPPGLAKKAG